jgi:hypothetical protein
MEVHLTQTEQKLKVIAANTGREAGDLVESAVAGYVQQLTQVAEHDASFRAAIEEALDDPRPLVPHAEVTAQFAKLRSDALRRLARCALFCQISEYPN